MERREKMKKAFKVILVDFLGLLVGILNGFLLPKFIELDQYAMIKTFSLYISYSGVFHIGFSDGLYIMLGGKSIDELKQGKIKAYLHALIKILLLTIGGLALISFFITKDIIFKLFILYTIPFQITLFQSLLLRATGQFEKYVKIRIFLNIINLLSTIVIISTQSAYSYMIVQIVGYGVLSISYLIKVLLFEKSKSKCSLVEVNNIIKIGFIIMIANTVTNLFFSLDRWFIKIFFRKEDFAFYSFGVSMLNLFITVIASITIVFYPYLTEYKKKSNIIKEIKSYIIIISSFIPLGYFVLDFIVSNFIKNYIYSLNILKILIICIPFISLINVLYSNLYKVNNWGKLYLKISIQMLIIATILNSIFLIVFKSTISIAYASLISLIFWYLYSSKDFEQLKISIKELIYLSIMILSYIILSEYFNSMLGFVFYLIIISIQVYVLYKAEFMKMLKLILKIKK